MGIDFLPLAHRIASQTRGAKSLPFLFNSFYFSTSHSLSHGSETREHPTVYIMADFRQWALEFVLADNEGQQTVIAQKAANGIL